MEPIEFLKSAEVLLEKESVAEVECRNAASRAYYSAYHSCLDLSKRYPTTNDHRGKKDVGMHEKLIQTLCEHQDEQMRTVGHSLNQVKIRRVKADYKLVQNFTLQDAKFTVNSVQKLLQEIGKIQPV
jgi:uncharacterized protein (UPF0332 family)